ncbi:MAG: fluoride efflux transporter CrcB [Chloroflexi bacterium]|nr:fluoride efflux transporter CrcB [Chloroflexota bacterium]MDA1219448.1 fluoride efflux transporter CrcB [Chloroflexota bacterium]
MTWLLVAMGGAGGSVLRYGVGRMAVAYLGPSTVMATFMVNLTGSLALGFFMGLALERTIVPVNLRSLLAVGFLGGYTTFSTFTFESIRLVEDGELFRAAVSVLGNVVLGLVAAYLGILLGRAVS